MADKIISEEVMREGLLAAMTQGFVSAADYIEREYNVHGDVRRAIEAARQLPSMVAAVKAIDAACTKTES